MKRPDGRAFDELRKIECEVGVIPNANGSARFTIGKTVAIAAVYGPRTMYPKHDQEPKNAVLNCKYNLMSFSVDERKKPAPSRRDTELSLITSNSLSSVVFLEAYPRTVIDVYIEIPQADAGTRCAGICAASMALADAGIQMRGLVGSISVGTLGKQVVADLTKEEEDWEEGATDMPIAYSPETGLLTSLQLDGEIDKNSFKEALDLGIKKCVEIIELEKKALKKNYEKEGEK